MIGIVAGCKTQGSYERWFEDNALEYKTVTCIADAIGVDVMVFCGGPDIGVNEERDKLETEILKFCIQNSLPVWGGCRGMQLVAHYLGADLIDDLGEGNVRHRAEGEPGHKVSKFHDILFSDGRCMRTNSRHHQAIKNPPFKYSLSAKSNDGVWELIASDDGLFFLVQCHPEMEEMKGTEIGALCLNFIKSKVNNKMELLKKLYSINSKSGNESQVKHLVLSQLNDLQLDIKEDSFGNVFITKGKAEVYPCVAAHLDEVHLPTERKVIEKNGMIYAVDPMGTQVGIGADDKNGVWMIIQLLHTEPILKAALFVQEEKDGDLSGCRGSNACDLSFFDNCKYVLQCDRKGDGDLVSYSEKAGVRLCDDNFIPQDLLNKYEYEVVNGGKTDVVALRMRGLKIPCCNISCGYYNAHHADEYTIWDDLQNSLAFVQELIHTL